MKTMRVFTINNGLVEDGAKVIEATITKNGKTRKVPVIVIGKNQLIQVKLTYMQRRELAKHGLTTVTTVKRSYVRSNAGYRTILKSQRNYDRSRPHELLCVFLNNNSKPNGKCERLQVSDNTDYIEPVYKPFQIELIAQHTGVQTFYRDLRYDTIDHFLDYKPNCDSKSYTEVLMNKEESIAAIPTGSTFSIECYSDPANRTRLTDFPEGDPRRSLMPIINFTWNGFSLSRTPF